MIKPALREGFFLVIADGLLEERFGFLVNQTFAGNHDGGLADVTHYPPTTEFFCDSAHCA
jgi:hypothetical protein